MKLAKKLLSILLCTVLLLGCIAAGGDGFADLFDDISIKASAETNSAGTFKVTNVGDVNALSSTKTIESLALDNSPDILYSGYDENNNYVEISKVENEEILFSEEFNDQLLLITKQNIFTSYSNSGFGSRFDTVKYFAYLTEDGSNFDKVDIIDNIDNLDFFSYDESEAEDYTLDNLEIIDGTAFLSFSYHQYCDSPLEKNTSHEFKTKWGSYYLVDFVVLSTKDFKNFTKIDIPMPDINISSVPTSVTIKKIASKYVVFYDKNVCFINDYDNNIFKFYATYYVSDNLTDWEEKKSPCWTLDDCNSYYAIGDWSYTKIYPAESGLLICLYQLASEEDACELVRRMLYTENFKDYSELDYSFFNYNDRNGSSCRGRFGIYHMGNDKFIAFTRSGKPATNYDDYLAFSTLSPVSDKYKSLIKIQGDWENYIITYNSEKCGVLTNSDTFGKNFLLSEDYFDTSCEYILTDSEYDIIYANNYSSKTYNDDTLSIFKSKTNEGVFTLIYANGQCYVFTAKDATYCFVIDNKVYLVGSKKSTVTDLSDIIKADEPQPHTHQLKTVTVPSTCTVAGMEYQVCEICGNVIGDKTVLPLAEHTSGPWKTEVTATIEHTGLMVQYCTVCNKVINEKIIDKIPSKTVKDETSGISLTYSDKYTGDIRISVSEIFDGSSLDVVNTKTNAAESKIFDIKMFINNVETQPDSSVVVSIPLPEGYDYTRTFVYHVDTATGNVEKVNARYENGYMVFTTDHFSYYAVVEENAATSLFARVISFLKRLLDLFIVYTGKLIDLINAILLNQA